MKERIAEWMIYQAAVTVIVTLVLIFVFIGKEALPVITSRDVHKEVTLKTLFLPQADKEGKKRFVWQPVSKKPKYSLAPLILGTLKVTFVAILFAVPLSIAAALFTSEFAPWYLRELIKPVIELLAGVPSVVLGFFALMVLAEFLQHMFGFTFRLNAVNAGMALGLAVIPIVYTVSEDAFSAVPKSYREASIALGANTWQTARRVVLPAAMPGVFAACVLGFGRAIGETMIVLMSSGNAAIFSLPLSDSLRTLSATIAAELAEVVVGSPHYHVLFFIGSLLFVFTFVINFLGQWFVKRLNARLTGQE